ncbi:hypothetical protein ATZ36_13900 [Candidatus Endomicrobiellum trichonymphae]|uniref:Uncharacterized protein n=1 Tax=Endomicrobium trichonymphae TaxID=1408204 RepID=A0A1E5IM87_ENDTX|nr:hypothetical protein ATZ36_13900 [Candidatus Endomicrobium trichonymphae]
MIFLYTSAVGTPKPGFTRTIFNFPMLFNGVTISPVPSHRAVPPVRKKGTSAPSFIAICSNSSFVVFIFHSLIKALSVEAASEEPPPRPAPVGISFLKYIFTPLSVL